MCRYKRAFSLWILEFFGVNDVRFLIIRNQDRQKKQNKEANPALRILNRCLQPIFILHVDDVLCDEIVSTPFLCNSHKLSLHVGLSLSFMTSESQKCLSNGL